MNCGREPGGTSASEQGICPAATHSSYDGLNSGKNGGRICWAIAGTLCEGEVQGTFAAKFGDCVSCHFLTLVSREEERFRIW